MKKLITPIATICVVALTITACKKTEREVPANEIPDSVLAQIQTHGFSTDGARKVEGGYLVEGDIILSEEQLNSTPTSPNMIIAARTGKHP